MKKSRVKNVQALISEHVKQHISMYTFVSVLLLIGVIFGAIVVNSLHVEQKQDLLFYVDQFLSQINDNQSGGEGVFFDAYTSHLKYMIFIWVLGISMVGLPLIFILVFLKGVLIGFTVGFFVNQLGLKGFYLAIVSILPQNLIIVPLLIVISSIAISFSIKLIKQLFGKHKYSKMKVGLLPYTGVFVMIACVILLPTVVEVYLSPILMERILSFYQ
ncbi:MAG: stage II sporulation protein M [Bacillaceae bacterium]